MTELWIEVYPGYKVSNFGKIVSIKRNKLLKLNTDKNGYLCVGITVNGKRKLKKIHRLVAKAFLSDYSDSIQVNHKDENKANNIVTNLEMCNNKYNCTYGSRRTKLAKPVLQFTLDGILIKEWESIREINRTLGYAQASIIACCKGQLKDSHTGKTYPSNSAYGYKWKYKIK